MSIENRNSSQTIGDKLVTWVIFKLPFILPVIEKFLAKKHGITLDPHPEQTLLTDPEMDKLIDNLIDQ